MGTYLRLLIIGRRILAISAMIGSVWLLWHVMSWLPWEVDCVITAAAALAFTYRFDHEIVVRILKRPKETWDGVPLHRYVPGECYEVSRSIGDYLELQGYAVKESGQSKSEKDLRL